MLLDCECHASLYSLFAYIQVCINDLVATIAPGSLSLMQIFEVQWWSIKRSCNVVWYERALLGGFF